YLQWHFRVNGADRLPPEPILRDIRTIENRDALIEYDERVLERDASGAPVTGWDGETMKPHPVTGKPVPDETARVEVYRYVNPRAATWPKADYIIGNPPFIGNKRMRDRLGDGYTEVLRAAYAADVASSVDLVMYWWFIAAARTARGEASRFGFITTNSIGQGFNRSILEIEEGLDLVFVVPDHPWIDAEEGAAVRIAITVAEQQRNGSRRLLIVEREGSPDPNTGERPIRFSEKAPGQINSDLSAGVNTRAAARLRANSGIAFTGMYPLGSGFILDDEALQVSTASNDDAILKRFRTARDLAQRPRGSRIIDFYPRSEAEAREASPALYQWVLSHVKPERDVNPVAERRRNWWLFTRPIPDLRKALSSINRFIAVPRTAKYYTFQFIPSDTVVDTTVVAVASDDALLLGYLSSHIHKTWAVATGGRLGKGNDLRYQHQSTFLPYPFPADFPDALAVRTRTEAEALDALRKRVLAEHPDLTLTRLYNVLEALREGRALTAAERDIHDRGLVTLIRQHHDAIDEGVADAYGWGDEHRAGTLDEETILTRLVALNKERAAEEARGMVRYLRPAFQDPGYRAPVAGTLDLGEAVVVPVSNVIPWPATLPEQVGAVQSILAAAPAPLAAGDIARSFKGKRAATVRPVLDALAGLGMARRLNDGRYAA
ncbi:MAG: putative methyltransferase, partial [Sphingomonas bacterium]|nr:putative methyltransferase [Sphingomonas bacterium]